MRLQLVSALAWAASLVSVAASPAPAPVVAVRTRNYPGTSDEWTIAQIKRRLLQMVHHKRENVFNASMEINRSWSGATLYSKSFEQSSNHTLPGGESNGSETDKNKPDGDGNGNQAELEVSAGIEIKCQECYIKAGASAQLSINEDFDFSDTFRNVSNQFEEELKNMTETAADSIHAYFKNLWGEIKADRLDKDDFNFDNFHVDMDFDIDVPEMPDVELTFTIDELDLFMVIEASLSAAATLTIPLFKSQTPAGISAGPGLEVGAFATVDLILSVEGSIDLRTGFHLKLDDPVGFKLALFSRNVSEVIFNGAKFEFLPVTVHAANVVLKGVLRVGMHAGFELSSDSAVGKFFDGVGDFFGDAFDNFTLNFGAGMEVGIHSHVAELLTNVTAGDVLEAEEDCALRVIQEYTLGIGAYAGATINFRTHTWGPQPSHTVPLFYTTLADVCAITATAKPATLKPRQIDPPNTDLTTTTLTTTTTYSAVGCSDSKLLICPASLQATSVTTSVKTLVTSVPSGVEATFPVETIDGVPSTVPFGKNINNVAATTGSPVSFVPPPPPPTTSAATTKSDDDGGFGQDVDEFVDDVKGWLEQSTGGVSNKVILGVSLGLGLPLLVAAIAGLVLCMRRRKYEAVPKSERTALEYHGPYQSPAAAAAAESGSSERDELMAKKTPVVAVGVVSTPGTPFLDAPGPETPGPEMQQHK